MELENANLTKWLLYVQKSHHTQVLMEYGELKAVAYEPA